jgi:transcriptional regulator
MYVPKPNAVGSDAEVRSMIDATDIAHLVSTTADGLLATTLPVLLEGDSLLGHVARANPHWRGVVAGSESMAILVGPDAYVSPAWYATKREHGRVVPTWNYTSVHVYGTLVVHDERDWKLGLVRRLTERHELRRDEPWGVDDAPAEYIDRMLDAIVGLELRISRIDAKRKVSQGRDQRDIDGAIAGLESGGTDAQRAVAAEMRRG